MVEDACRDRGDPRTQQYLREHAPAMDIRAFPKRKKGDKGKDNKGKDRRKDSKEKDKGKGKRKDKEKSNSTARQC